MDRVGGIAGIGNTPVVRLASQDDGSSAEIWVKLEAANPTGSYKDRMALAMIEAAEADGRLRPGQLVVEYTGGSTGSSLALVCAVKGYPLRIVSSDAFAAEKTATMRALGAEVELIPSPQGITPDLIPAMMKRAAEIAAETGGFATDQFNNTDMVEGYRLLSPWMRSDGLYRPPFGKPYLPVVLRLAARRGSSPICPSGQAPAALKYRRATERRPWQRSNHFSICSTISLLSP